MKLINSIKNFIKNLLDTNSTISSTRFIYLVGSFWNMTTTTLLVYLLRNELTPILIGAIAAFFSAIQGVWTYNKIKQKGQELNNKPPEK